VCVCVCVWGRYSQAPILGTALAGTSELPRAWVNAFWWSRSAQRTLHLEIVLTESPGESLLVGHPVANHTTCWNSEKPEMCRFAERILVFRWQDDVNSPL